MILEKSDVDGFEAKYAATLGQRAASGDVDPASTRSTSACCSAWASASVLVKRLAASTYTFTTDETVVIDRHELPWPATREDAETLWRLRIMHEVMLERMAKLKAAEPKAPAKKPAKELSIEETIDARYDRMLAGYKEYDGSVILQDYLSSLTHVFDPHSDYLAPSSKVDFDIRMKLSLTGIGAMLRSEDGYPKIMSLVPGAPADAGKQLKVGDRVEAVAQGDGPFAEVVGLNIERVIELIRGEKGTRVRLRVLPADASDSSTRVVIAIVRDVIKLTDQEAKARVYTLPAKTKDGRASMIGVLDLPSFYADAHGGEGSKSLTRDTARLLAELKRRSVDAAVVDLRRDGGGSLAEAVSLSGLFVKGGPIVQVKDPYGSIRVLRSSAPAPAYDGPLVVLTSRDSASASEIFAAAMQDYGRGLIVGDKSTFGKGTVQTVLDLDDYLPPGARTHKAGALKLTIQKFYRVSGGSTQNRGVIPDIHLPSAGDLSETTESAQKDALPYDEIAPAAYVRDGRMVQRIPSLLESSDERTEISKEFEWIRDDLDRWQKQKSEKAVSLNLAKRLAERKADEDRVEERKKERAERQKRSASSDADREESPAFQEITLAMLDGKAPAVARSKATARSSDAPDAMLDETLRIASDWPTLRP